MSVQVFPDDCLLVRSERNVFLGTMLQDEVPCEGCPRANCPMKGAVAMAEALSGEHPDGVKCPRCKNEMRDWRVEGDCRVWVCRAEVGEDSKDVFPSSKSLGNNRFYCNGTYSIFAG